MLTGTFEVEDMIYGVARGVVANASARIFLVRDYEDNGFSKVSKINGALIPGEPLSLVAPRVIVMGVASKELSSCCRQHFTAISHATRIPLPLVRSITARERIYRYRGIGTREVKKRKQIEAVDKNALGETLTALSEISSDMVYLLNRGYIFSFFLFERAESLPNVTTDATHFFFFIRSLSNVRGQNRFVRIFCLLYSDLRFLSLALMV